MPRENPPTRLVATPARPVISMTSLTREALMLWVAAMVGRCERALRPGVHGACLQQGADLA
jgi:hypothetical protein